MCVQCRWVAVSVLASMVGACEPPAPKKEPHPGVPMEIRPEDGPPTRDQLIAVARYYYPSMEYAELTYTGAEVTRLERATPQWQARDKAAAAARAKRGEWREMIRVLEEELPDYWVEDRTLWYLVEPAYAVEIASKDASRRGELRGMVSAIAPVYFIFETVSVRTMQHPMDPAFAHAAAVLEREIRARYPYHPLDWETALTIVPDLAKHDLWYRETTLLDLLMSTYW